MVIRLPTTDVSESGFALGHQLLARDGREDLVCFVTYRTQRINIKKESVAKAIKQLFVRKAMFEKRCLSRIIFLSEKSRF